MHDDVGLRVKSGLFKSLELGDHTASEWIVTRKIKHQCPFSRLSPRVVVSFGHTNILFALKSENYPAWKRPVLRSVCPAAMQTGHDPSEGLDVAGEQWISSKRRQTIPKATEVSTKGKRVVGHLARD